MPTILHILKEPHSPVALEMINEEARNPDLKILILLIQEAVRKPIPSNSLVKIFILKEDLAERGSTLPNNSNYTSINYQGMLDLIYQADKIVTW